MIYKNNIENVRSSIVAFGENGWSGQDIGLLIKCNDQTLNQLNDIDIRDDGAISGMIKDEQGGCGTGDEFHTPAGNTFTDLSGGATTVHLNTDVLSSAFNYHYRSFNFTETPLSYTPIATPVGCLTTYDNLCPSKQTTQDEDAEIDFPAYITHAGSATEVELLEQQYFNHLFEINDVPQVITYLTGKSGKNRRDSLTLCHAYAAIQDYTNAQAVLSGMSSSDNVVTFLQGLLTQMASTSGITYNTTSTYSDGLLPLVLDSTKLTSIYAENVLRVTNLFQYPMRIPFDSLTGHKKEKEIIRKAFENKLSNILIYPNPNAGRFTIILNDIAYQNGKEIFVTDITGRKIYNTSIEKNHYIYTLSLDNAKGMYIVEIRNSNKKAIDSQKIIIK